ncbi:hypothetical protein [Rhizobium sp. LjRoot254]|uniref:hypothetical protein n=1 Tax=Rhizobium sp. LjRoot254 TaxID=3342297 RepID=UPI003ECCE4C4
MPRILLHIGAHKTATSYMQKKLALNVDLLARRGIHYDPLDVFRKNFTILLNEGVTRENEFVQTLRGTARGMTILVSEENIMGVPGDLPREHKYYIRARERLARTAELFHTATPEIFLSLREYAGFAVSMYSEYIRHQKYLPFAEYRAIFEASNFSWLSVIDDIHAAVPGAKLTLWDFADFRNLEKQVFQSMLGFDPDIFENPVGPVRESFSEVAIRAIEVLSGALKHNEVRKLINPIARNLPKGDQYPAFDPMDAEAKASLKARYKADLAAIAAKYPAVTFIGNRP